MATFFQITLKTAHMGVVCARVIAFLGKIFAHLNKNLFLCTRISKATLLSWSLK